VKGKWKKGFGRMRLGLFKGNISVMARICEKEPRKMTGLEKVL
jgi:hypothetical protein